jgi:amidase
VVTAAGALPELVRLDARALSEAIHARRVSCVEVMHTYLEHIQRLNPTFNAIVSLQPAEALLAQAAERDRQLARGEDLGWLHGFPHAVKDLTATAGIRTTYGSPIFKDFVPQEDALIVERLKRAGAIIIGKTNTPEFGLGSQTYNAVFGPTRNAYDPGRTAGGSSGGAAVAVALRLLPVADGSDMGGSLRNPAAFNNVLGFRPSQGRVPRGPATELFLQQLGTDGPMARTLADLALLLGVLAGYDARAPLSWGDATQPEYRYDVDALAGNTAGLRLGWLGDLGGALPMQPGVLELCRAALGTFAALGCTVEEAVPDFDPERLWRAWLVLRQWLQTGALVEHYRDPQRRTQLKPEAQWEVERGLALTGEQVYQASTVRSAWYRTLLSLFQRFDFLLLPSAQVFPFDVTVHWPTQIAGVGMDTYHRWMQVAVPATMAGCPAISLPVGFNPDGLPMGLQAIGRPRADLDVLRLAWAYEQATAWRAVLPAVLG